MRNLLKAFKTLVLSARLMATRSLRPNRTKCRAILGVLLCFGFVVVMCGLMIQMGDLTDTATEAVEKDELPPDVVGAGGVYSTDDFPDLEDDSLANNTKDTRAPLNVSAEPDMSACTDRDLYLLLLVFSPPGNVAVRQAIRKSWGNSRPVLENGSSTKFLVVFVVSVLRPAENARLSKEISENKDILLGDFDDSPQHTARKIIMALKWLGRIEHECRPWFVLKTVDGIFHNTRLFLKKLETSIEPPFNVYRGKVVRNDKPNRNRKHPNHVPVVKYPKERFPDLIQGPLYLFSYDVILRLLAATRKVHEITMEEVYIGLLAEKAGVLPHNDDSFSLMKKTSNDCVNVKLLFIYDVSPSDHQKLFHLVEKEGELHHCQAIIEKEGL